MIEFRVCWSAGSNISFHGATDWDAWDDDPDTTEKDVEDALYASKGSIAESLSMALEESGFECWVETRVVEDAHAT